MPQIWRTRYRVRVGYGPLAVASPHSLRQRITVTVSASSEASARFKALNEARRRLRDVAMEREADALTLSDVESVEQL